MSQKNNAQAKERQPVDRERSASGELLGAVTATAVLIVFVSSLMRHLREL